MAGQPRLLPSAGQRLEPHLAGALRAQVCDARVGTSTGVAGRVFNAATRALFPRWRPCADSTRASSLPDPLAPWDGCSQAGAGQPFASKSCDCLFDICALLVAVLGLQSLARQPSANMK